ncbi:MAG: hypothetical protein RIT35_1051 [Pseudomonadota bacterium]|jgi:hypothetical protein
MNYSYKSIGKSISESICFKGMILIWVIVFLVLGLFYFLFFNNKYLNKMCGCNKKEGFKCDDSGGSSGAWSDDLLNRFTSYQSTANDNRNNYNMEVIQQQASPAEAETLIKTGYWPWSSETKYEYTDAIWHHPIIKVNVGNALDYAMKTYNETAAKLLMSWNTKEGQFLLFGGKGSNYDTIKCSTDLAMIGVIKKEFKDDYVENSVPIQNADIPNQMPGFSFLNDVGPCNPCLALNNDYSCPFKLRTKDGDDTMSPVWSRLFQRIK